MYRYPNQSKGYLAALGGDELIEQKIGIRSFLQINYIYYQQSFFIYFDSGVRRLLEA